MNNYASEYIRSSLSSALNTVRAPGTNVNGFEVRVVAGVVANGQVVRVMTKNQNPTGILDPAAKTIALIAGNQVQILVTLPYKVPPGHGLYEQCGDAAVRS